MRTRETTLGPSVGRSIDVEESVLLFETEPRDMLLYEIHVLLGEVTVICSVGRAIVVVALCEDENVVTAAEGISEDGSGAKIYIGIVTRCLVCR